MKEKERQKFRKRNEAPHRVKIRESGRALSSRSYHFGRREREKNIVKIMIIGQLIVDHYVMNGQLIVDNRSFIII